MMRGTLFAVALAVVAGSACPAMAETLAPSSPWNLHYDDDSCALRRTFGEGDNQAYLEFRRFGPGLTLQAIIASKRMKARQPVRFRYRLGDAGDWREPGGAITVSNPDDFSGVIFSATLVQLPEYDEIADEVEREDFLRTIDFKAAEIEQAAAIDTIALRGAFLRELKLNVGSLGAPIRVLNDCVDELMTHWNIDVEAHKTLSRRG